MSLRKQKSKLNKNSFIDEFSEGKSEKPQSKFANGDKHQREKNNVSRSTTKEVEDQTLRKKLHTISRDSSEESEKDMAQEGDAEYKR